MDEYDEIDEEKAPNEVVIPLTRNQRTRNNVNAIEELVKNLDMQRHFEINVKLIKKASDIDSAATKLMSLPS